MALEVDNLALWRWQTRLCEGVLRVDEPVHVRLHEQVILLQAIDHELVRNGVDALLLDGDVGWPGAEHELGLLVSSQHGDGGFGLGTVVFDLGRIVVVDVEEYDGR
ncbi:hypothetical protein HYQ46_001011 [Verticillium longisporum]|nr:hypothetical protein HYQ46_001011 [Verticillium longisporum]